MRQTEVPLKAVKAKRSEKPTPIMPERTRLRRPVRNQVEMILRDLNSLVSEEHPVGAIWEFLQGLSLAAFYSSIKVAPDVPGRPASDPQALLALWLYAPLEGVGSARRLDKQMALWRSTGQLSHAGGL